ncbi:hypothetical protein GCM10018952_07200 [Streptosporangium vulgare]
MVARLVIAAPASGAGKTTVATGLMAALARRGMAVSPHKVGPDYIDPSYHAMATGRPGRNLDPWLVGEELVAPLFLHGAAGADIAVVEGVMGLYDGAGSTEFASTAHVARLLGAPVVLVVDAAKQSRSVAALVHGFASYDTRIRLGGVILNRIGSERHEAICREALAESGVPVLGAIRRSDAVATPSRHLGLVPRRRAPHPGGAGHGRRRGPGRRLLRPGGTPAPGPYRAVVAGRPVEPRTARRSRHEDRGRRRAGLHLRLHRAGRAAGGGGRRGRPLRPARRRGPPRGGLAGSSSGAVSPRSTRPSCRPTSRCASGSPRSTGRSRPSARACCTSPGVWTAGRCAGSSTSRPG